MFSSVLIANRGEIAVRVARSASLLGMRTIAVYSQADAGALHVRVCDEAVAIGPAPPRESYLNIDRLIAAARQTGAQCVHPGYGFLSENAAFAEACAAAGLVFVGPPPAAIRAMGLKDRAKALMEKAGVPVIPGYHGEGQAADFLSRKAYEIGYPVLIKAVAGGGGRGMRRVARHADFEAALEAARREAQSAFGDPRVLIEKYVETPRHVEFQVLADCHGRTIHLGERDCSLQRRYQKVIEEAPAPGMTPALRAEMGAAAVRAAREVGYVGAGTVEFICDGTAGLGGLRSGGFWFMEMNTRLQVEHPVSELVTEIDLVEWQFRIAAGDPLAIAEDIAPAGHAVEARLYAEDPDRGFLPSPGRIAALEWPQGEGIRVDAGAAAGDAVPPHYDPMIGKVIAHAATRDEALDRLSTALRDTVVIGPRVNAPFLKALADHAAFRAATFDTGFIERHRSELLRIDPEVEAQAIAQGVAALFDRERKRIAAAAATPVSPQNLAYSDQYGDKWCDPWAANDGFSLGPPRTLPIDIVVNGTARQAVVSWGADGARVRIGAAAASDDGRRTTEDGPLEASALGSSVVRPPSPVLRAPASPPYRIVELAGGVVVVAGGRQYHVALPRHEASGATGVVGDGNVRAPMNGRLVAVFVALGDRVVKGARVAAMEAMKMEHNLTAPLDGTVAEIAAAPGTQVAEGAAVLRVEADAGEERPRS
jgi:3-methylcrotonyl-CoA carboxylase alpha subunit